MKASRKKKLEANGWNVGDAKDFLGLTAKESKKVNEMVNKPEEFVERLRKVRGIRT